MSQRHLGLPESESGLIACFAISTWLADRLPNALTLTISGPDEQLGIQLLRLVRCVCHHPMMLAEPTPVATGYCPCNCLSRCGSINNDQSPTCSDFCVCGVRGGDCPARLAFCPPATPRRCACTRGTIPLGRAGRRTLLRLHSPGRPQREAQVRIATARTRKSAIEQTSSHIRRQARTTWRSDECFAGRGYQASAR